MKILLLGEYSGLHKNLQTGLVRAGHSVDLASDGDGFKGIFGNIPLPKPKSRSIWDRQIYRMKYYEFIQSIKGYDVVQLINVDVLIRKKFPYKKALKSLKENNKKVFLLAAGSDAFYWQKSRQKLRYGPFDDELKYDAKKKRNSHQTKNAYKFNEYIAQNVDGIIPIMYEYAIGYQDLPNIRPTIPLPIDIESIKHLPISAKPKISVWHGVTRYGFKGTRHIEKAFRLINQNHGKNFNCKIHTSMPLQEYLRNLKSQDIIVDQVNSYSYGMNAIYAAAFGRVVLSGAEPECLRELGVKSCPIVNVIPNAIDIQEALIELEQKNKLQEIGYASRRYIEETHCCKKVARKYLDEWCRA